MKVTKTADGTGFLIESISGQELDTLTISSYCVLVIEKPVSAYKRKKQLVNVLVNALWKSKKARNKYRIET